MSFDIRVMTRADLDVVLGWAREEGWNPGLDDADAFYAEDPTGFLAGWLDRHPIASVSVVKYGDGFAFLGLYIVRPQWRGKGYGKAIWDAGIASAGNRTIGLDGVVAQQHNYRKSGFVLAHRSARWSGVLAATAHTNARVVEKDDVPAIAALDRACFPAPRPQFLAHWLAGTASRQTMCITDAGSCLGYGTIRRSVDGYKIGPLFAETPDVAEALLRGLAAVAGGQPVFIDIPATNEAAVSIAERLGLAPAFETARMYRGAFSELPVDKIFGITTLELG